MFPPTLENARIQLRLETVYLATSLLNDHSKMSRNTIARFSHQFKANCAIPFLSPLVPNLCFLSRDISSGAAIG